MRERNDRSRGPLPGYRTWDQRRLFMQDTITDNADDQDASTDVVYIRDGQREERGSRRRGRRNNRYGGGGYYSGSDSEEE